MSAFLERELKRVDYVAERSAIRGAEAEGQQPRDDANAAGGGDSDAPPLPPPPAETSGEEGKAGDGDMQLPPLDPEELARDEAAYHELEAKFIEELGLAPEELPEEWHAANKLMESVDDSAEAVSLMLHIVAERERERDFRTTATTDTRQTKPASAFLPFVLPCLPIQMLRCMPLFHLFKIS